MSKGKLERYLIKEVSDEFNPELVFRSTYSKLLVDIASGKVDAKQQARKELCNRGVGKSGNWVGFEQAHKEWGIKWKYD